MSRATERLRAPFPWFGGKSRAAHLVWDAIGNPPNYVEPFAGSLAVLLGRPHTPRTETVNDADGFIANFWRALQADPDALTAACDWPVNEADLHARHAWLLATRTDLTKRLMGDPEFYDTKIAGWWVWGISQWIGGQWCSGIGPWKSVSGRLVCWPGGMGLQKRLPSLGDAGRGVHRMGAHVANELTSIARRLRHVRVACGDWSRVMGYSVTSKHGCTGVFLDPPYPAKEHSAEYSVSSDVWNDVVDWCNDNGNNQTLRIVLAGYDGFPAPKGWRVVRWKAHGGYGSQSNGRGRMNATRESLWLSPACLTTDLFSAGAA